MNKRLVFMTCKNCGKEVSQIEHKRVKEFCNSTCRSNFWQKEKRKEKNRIIKLAKNSKEVGSENKTKNNYQDITFKISNPIGLNDKEIKRHPLWKEGDPAERTMAFYLKYDAYTYDELQNKLK